MDIETLRTVAGGAIVLAGLMGSALTLAVVGAMMEAVWPGTDTRVRVAVVSALSVALRAFMLVIIGLVAFLTLAATMGYTVVTLIMGVFVTYVHPYRGGSGHRARGYGRRGAMGWHQVKA
jgi:hypothetical protein